MMAPSGVCRAEELNRTRLTAEGVGGTSVTIPVSLLPRPSGWRTDKGVHNDPTDPSEV